MHIALASPWDKDQPHCLRLTLKCLPLCFQIQMCCMKLLSKVGAEELNSSFERTGNLEITSEAGKGEKSHTLVL